MFRARKVDANQKDIVRTLELCGATVCDLSAVGKGAPDLLVGYQNENFLMEVKNKNGKNRLTPPQKKWHAEWRGAVHIVRTPEEACQAIGVRML